MGFLKATDSTKVAIKINKNNISIKPITNGFTFRKGVIWLGGRISHVANRSRIPLRSRTKFNHCRSEALTQYISHHHRRVSDCPYDSSVAVGRKVIIREGWPQALAILLCSLFPELSPFKVQFHENHQPSVVPSYML